jgi:hypothetical protein
MKLVQFICIAGVITLSFAGCAGKPSPGEIMREHATLTQDQADLQTKLVKDWERGHKLVQSGEERVDDGEDLMDSAKKDYDKAKKEINQGKDEIAKGTELMEESERRFRENFKDFTPNASK